MTIRTLPRTTLDADMGWEIIIPEPTLAGTGLAKCSITSDGVYIESESGRYDLLPFDELADLLDDADALSLDEPLDVDVRRAELITALNGTVTSMSGPIPPCITGQARMRERWLNRDDPAGIIEVSAE